MAHLDTLADGRFELIEEVGTGGWGAVWRAWDRFLEVPRAIKLLGPAVARNPELRRRFGDEARIMARLDHPNIVRMLDVGSEGERMFIVMELIEGGDLRTLIRREGPMAPAAAADVMTGVLSGLAAAHASGVVHRDMKPHNVLLGPDGVPRLTDFGIARGEREHSLMTREGVAMGTPGYMAPEQRRDARSADVRSDVFGAGATLFACLTGNDPFGLSLRARDDAQLQALPPAFAAVVWRATRPDPEERYPTALDLAAAITSARREQDSTHGYSLGETRPRREVPDDGLPAETSSFLGRGREVGSAATALVDDARLMLLMGPGGVGKSRMALRVARAWQRRTRGRAVRIDTTECRTPQDLNAAVGQALGLRAGGGAIELIGRALAGRGTLLLVLDGLDALAQDGGGAVAKWCAIAPELRILLTARQRLRLGGLQVRQVPPLAVPEPEEVDLVALAENPAVALFSDRARCLDPHFALDRETAPQVAELVRRLDGIPLAIELAAARIRTLGPADLLARLGARFSLLQDPDPQRPPRQRTLAETIRWSWAMLQPWERRTLSHCTPFRGGFALDAAESVVDLSEWAAAPPVAHCVEALCDRSLLLAGTDASGAPRLRVLESVRAFVEENEPAGVEAEQRHGAWFAKMGTVEALWTLNSEQGQPRLQRLSLEIDNLVVAARRALLRGDYRVACDTALAAGVPLIRRGRVQQARSLVAGALRVPGTAPGRRMRLLLELGQLQQMNAQIPEGRAAIEEAAAIARKARSPVFEAECAAILATFLVRSGDPEEAEVAIDRALEMVQRGLAGHQLPGLLADKGRISYRKGDFVAASKLFEQAVMAGSLRGDQEMVGWTTLTWTYALRALGEVDSAMARLHEASQLARVLDDHGLENAARDVQSGLLLRVGKTDEAIKLARPAAAYFMANGEVANAVASLKTLAQALHQGGEPEAARTHLRSALRLAQDLGSPRYAAEAESLLGTVALDMGQPAPARDHFLAAMQLATEAQQAALICTIRGGLAVAQLRLGQVDSARQNIDMAEAGIRAGDHQEHLALHLCRRGLIDMATDAPGAAQQALDEVLLLAGERCDLPRTPLAKPVAALRALLLPATPTWNER